MDQDQEQKKSSWTIFSNTISKIFSNFDLFGKEIKLNYKNHEKYRSGCGGFTTLLFLGLLMLYFWGQVARFINKEEIEVKTEKDYSRDPPILEIDPQDMVFAIKLQQDDFITRPYLNVTLQDRHYFREDGGELQKIKNNVPLERCTEQHFTNLHNIGNNDWKETFNFQGLGEFLCPPLNYEFKLGGMYTSEHFYFQKISIDHCQNDTAIIDENETYSSACAPQEEIDDYFDTESITLNIYFPNKLVNPDDPGNPVSKFLYDEVFFDLSPGKMYKTANINFRNAHIETDESLGLWEDVKINDFAIFEPGDMREQQLISTNTPGEFYLRRSPFSIKYFRSYRKIDDIISYIGGFVEATIIIATFVIGYYNDIQYSIALANQLYNFKSKQSEQYNAKQKVDDIQEVEKKNQMIEVSRQRRTNGVFQGRSGNRMISMHPSDIKDTILKRQKVLQTLQSNSIQTQDVIDQPIQIDDGKQDEITIDKYQITSQRAFQNKQNSKKDIYEGLGFTSRKDFLTQQFKEIMYRHKPLSEPAKYIFSRLFCCCRYSDDVILMKKARQRIKNDLDMHQILESIKEIDKLKNVLLDKDQAILFNFFPKPEIGIEKSIEDITDLKQRNIAQIQTRNSMAPENNLNLNSLGIAKKYAGQLKNNIDDKKKNSSQFDNLKSFQKLYSSYDILIKEQGQDLYGQWNKRLIKLLGYEMQEIFETSKLIKFTKDTQINFIQTFEESSESDFSNSSDNKSEIIDQQNNNKPYEIQQTQTNQFLIPSSVPYKNSRIIKTPSEFNLHEINDTQSMNSKASNARKRQRRHQKNESKL